MKAIFVRHGKTEGNESHTIMGWLPGSLSAVGRRQAVEKSRLLKAVRMDAIYSSDLARALQTAGEIAKRRRIRVMRTKGLREAYLGSLQGKEVSKAFDARLDRYYCEGGFPDTRPNRAPGCTGG